MLLDPIREPSDAVHDRPGSNSARVVAGRYQLRRPLNPSGRQQVYLAHDSVLDQPVVVRLSSATITPTIETRLVHEATILLQMQTPSLARLMDFGREGSEFYWVRSFVEGSSLVERCDQSSTVQQSLTLARCILSTLTELHREGVLCRSLRPSKLIVPRNGAAADAATPPVIVTDVGLAAGLTVDTRALSAQSSTHSICPPSKPGHSTTKSARPRTCIRPASSCSNCLPAGRRSTAPRSARCFWST